MLFGTLISFFLALMAFVPAHAGAKGSWHVSTDHGGIAFLGEIGPESASEFKALIAQHPDLRFVMLGSNGGRVIPALEIAEEIHARGLNTWIPKDLECHSACAFIFLAGRARQADGRLGVHQISGTIDMAVTQMVLARIYDSLLRYGVNAGVMNRMFETPAEMMHVFTDAEIAELSINRMAPEIHAPAPPKDQRLEFETVALLDSGAWQTRLMRNPDNGHYFCSMQSLDQAPMLRLVHYMTKRDAFVEILDIPIPISPENRFLKLTYVSFNKEPLAYSLNWQVEDQRTAWFDIKDEETGLIIMAPLALYAKLKLETDDGRLVGIYDLAGSLKAAQAFSRCALSSW